jgi:hypothetical protein
VYIIDHVKFYSSIHLDSKTSFAMTMLNSTTSTVTSKLPSQPHKGPHEPGAERDKDENIEASAKEGKDREDARRLARLEPGWLCNHLPAHCTEGKDATGEPCAGKREGELCSHVKCKDSLQVRIFFEADMHLRDKIRPDPEKGVFGWFHDSCRTHHGGLSPEAKVCAECKKVVEKAYAYTCQP